MNKKTPITAACIALVLILSACGGSPPPVAAPPVDAAATKTAMAHDEAMKKEAMVAAEATKSAMAKGDAMMVAKGMFTKIDGEHYAMGEVSIDKGADGKLVLKLTHFKTADGPDLYVHLSGNANPLDSGALMANGDLDLGKLQKMAGDQEYVLPAGFDAAKFKSVVIYCKTFSVVFSTAPLGA